jgi:hypothetical protein
LPASARVLWIDGALRAGDKARQITIFGRLQNASPGKDAR